MILNEHARMKREDTGEREESILRGSDFQNDRAITGSLPLYSSGRYDNDGVSGVCSTSWCSFGG